MKIYQLAMADLAHHDISIMISLSILGDKGHSDKDYISQSPGGCIKEIVSKSTFRYPRSCEDTHKTNSLYVNRQMHEGAAPLLYGLPSFYFWGGKDSWPNFIYFVSGLTAVARGYLREITIKLPTSEQILAGHCRLNVFETLPSLRRLTLIVNQPFLDEDMDYLKTI